MMIDKLTLLHDAQAITASNTVTGSSYDCGNITPKRRIGSGEPLSLVFTVDVAAAGDSGTSGDAFVFKAVQSASADLSASSVIIQRSVALASLTAGSVIEVPLPVGTPTLRYVGGMTDIAAGGDTITVSSFIMPRSFVQDWLAYAKGYAV